MPSTDREEGESVVMVAGERYGMGVLPRLGGQGPAAARRPDSHRRQLRKDPPLQLIGMGILPLIMPPEMRNTLPSRGHHPRRRTKEPFTATAAVETGLERELLAVGGVIPMILRRTITAAPKETMGVRS